MWDAGEDCSDDDDDERRRYDDSVYHDDDVSITSSHDEYDDKIDEDMMIALYSQVHHHHHNEINSFTENTNDKQMSADDVNFSNLPIESVKQQSVTDNLEFSVEDVINLPSKILSPQINTEDKNLFVYSIHSSSSESEHADESLIVIDIDSSSPQIISECIISDSNDTAQDSRSTKQETVDVKPKKEKKAKKKDKSVKEKWKPKQWVVVEGDSSSDCDSDNSESSTESVTCIGVTSSENNSIMINEPALHSKSHRILDTKCDTVGVQSDEVEDMTLEEIHKNMPDEDWDVIPEDRLSTSTPIRIRYYAPMKMKCHNCNETGHTSKCCPKPKKGVICCLCGDEGHVARACPNRICYSCLQSGHDSKDCQGKRRSWYTQCFRCSLYGHVKHECPDLWRQYHITVQSEEIVPCDQKENRQVYCYNCAQKGHFGYDCERPLMNRQICPIAPFVTSYDSQRKQNAQNSQKGKKRKFTQEDDVHENEKPSKSAKNVSTYTKHFIKKYSKDTRRNKPSKMVKRGSESQDFPRTYDEQDNSATTSVKNNSNKKKKTKKKKTKLCPIDQITEPQTKKKKKNGKKKNVNMSFTVDNNMYHGAEEKKKKRGRKKAYKPGVLQRDWTSNNGKRKDKKGKGWMESKQQAFVSSRGFHSKFGSYKH